MSEKKESPKYPIEYKEIVELLLKRHHIHSGIWGIYAELKFAAINTRDSSGEMLPAGVTGLKSIGITPFSEESTLAFDAAKLNPVRASRKKISK